MSDKVSQKAKGKDITQVAGDINININIDIDSEIDDAAKFLRDSKPAEAINLLERLWRRHNDKMTGHQKYRTQANIGHAYDQLNKYDEAARYWFKAFQYDSDCEGARALQAWAYFYQSNISKAQEIANGVLQKYPENTLARAVWIRTSSDKITLNDIEKQIPQHQKEEADVLLALASVASDKKEWKLAEQYLSEALKSSEGHPMIKEQLGRLLLQKAELWKYALIEKKPTQDEKASINKAIEYIIGACDEWKKQKKISQLVKAKLALVLAYQAIGNKVEAENNIRIAYELDNSSEPSACEYAALLANVGETNKAIDLLVPLIDKPEDIAVVDLYVQLLINRNVKDDKENALKLLKKHINKLENSIPIPCFNYIKQIVLLSVTLKGEDEATSYLEELPSDLLSDVSLKILKASVYISGENRDKSIEMALEIYLKDKDKLEWHEKRNLAILLQSLGQWEHAVNIWKEITSGNYLSQDLYNMLEAARRIEKADVILKFCSQLRENQVWDDKIINLELTYREKYNDSDTAISIMREYLKHCDNEDNAAMIRLRLSCLGMRTHRYELLENDRNKLPDVTKIHPYNGRLVVQILSYSSNPLEAVDYAYELWRLYPDDENVNLAYVGSILQIRSGVELPEYDTAEPGVAVLYEEKETKTWIIIENSSLGNIENSRGEYSEEHHISQKIIGKKKGEAFYLIKDELQERQAVICEILSKYLYRFQRCMEEFPNKFITSKNLRSFPGFKSDGTVNLEPMKQSAQSGEKSTEQIMAMYDSQLIPIYMLAKLRNVTEFVVMRHYASHDDLKIKTCFGTMEEWNFAISNAIRTKKYVIDMTSLVTLLFFEDDFWSKSEHELIISEGTYNRLKNIEAVQDYYVKNGGYFSSEKGQLKFVTKNVQQAKSEQERVKQFIEKISEHCHIESGINLLTIPANKRSLYIEAMGQDNTETLVLASRKDHILWTDDLALACLANSEFGCKRIWTQVVVNLFGGEKTTELNLKLFSYGYTFTKIGLNDLKTAVEQAKWQVNQKPLSEILPVFSDNNVSPESITTLFSQFVKYMWQNSTEFTAQQITLVVLNELSRRQLGLFIIKTLPVDNIFGLDCINAHKVRMVIDTWLKMRMDDMFLF